MNKKRELIYSAQTSSFEAGKAYANPRFFSTPRSDVSKVLLVGGWPKVEAAYLAAGVPVEHIDAPAIVAPVPVVSPIVNAAPEAFGSVEIPTGWADLPWTKAEAEGGLTLRSLASSVSTVPVLNKSQATAAVEAAVAARIAKAKDLGWVDGEPTLDQANAWIADVTEHRRREEPQEALGGRSIREAHDIIAKAGGEWQDGSSIEELAELLQLAEA